MGSFASQALQPIRLSCVCVCVCARFIVTPSLTCVDTVGYVMLSYCSALRCRIVATIAQLAEGSALGCRRSGVRILTGLLTSN